MSDMRMMVVFEKGFTLRHIGHLDLMRTVQRAFRRSGLPVTYSKGFSPHMELSFASPLGVGIAGMREIMDVPLAGEVSEEEFAKKLGEALPAPMRVVRARLISDGFPTLMALVAASRYTLRLEAGEAAQAVQERLPEFMALTEYMAMRKTKSGESLCDIRPFVREARVDGSGGGEIHCVLEATQQGTLKPSLFVSCLREFLGLKELPYVVVREEILCRQKDGTLIPMEDYPDA